MDLYANRCGSQSGLAEARCRGRSAAKRCVERAGGGSRSTRTSIRGAACTPSPQNSAMPRPEHHPATFTHSLDGRMGTPERPRPRIRDLEPRCVEPPHHSRGSNAEANVLRLLEIGRVSAYRPLPFGSARSRRRRRRTRQRWVGRPRSRAPQATAASRGARPREAAEDGVAEVDPEACGERTRRPAAPR